MIHVAAVDVLTKVAESMCRHAEESLVLCWITSRESASSKGWGRSLAFTKLARHFSNTTELFDR